MERPSISLGKILDHEQLYRAYPDLADVQVALVDCERLPCGRTAAYRLGPEGASIEIAQSAAPEEIQGELLSAIQHVINDIESRP